jgi:hypothetical protein
MRTNRRFSRLKPTSDGVQVGKGAHEEPGADHQQQRNGGLQGDQRLPQPRAEASAVAARTLQAIFLECRSEIHLGGLDRGSEAKEYSRRHGKHEGEAENRPIERGAQREVLPPISQQPVIKRMPARATPKPRTPPVSESSTLSVSICCTTRHGWRPVLRSEHRLEAVGDGADR